MMHLAIAVNNRDSTLIPTLVSLFTWAKAYHCELIFSDGTTLQATPEKIGYTTGIQYDRYKWVILPLPQIDDTAEAKILGLADAILEKNPKYDYIGAIFGRWAPALEDGDRWYCSELCRYLIKDEIPALNDDKWITPDRLWRAVADDLDTNYKEYTEPARCGLICTNEQDPATL